MIKDNIFISLLKKHTDIDKRFIDTFFKKFKIGGELDFDIKDKDVAKFLGIEMVTLKKRLLNAYSKSNRFIEKVDYIKIKNGRFVDYMINYPAFEKLAMSGESEKSESVRLYFIKLREFIVENQRLIYQAMENNRDLNLYSDYESIYFIAIDERKKNIFKIGRTRDIVQRLRNYNVGRVHEVELKYFALVKNSLLIENCMKLKLEKNQVYENREIYKIDPKKLKKIIDDCYCKFVPKKKHDSLYNEILNISGLYTYIKDKVNIKPYIIIGKDL
jgi:phage anti-repressor protein